MKIEGKSRGGSSSNSSRKRKRRGCAIPPEQGCETQQERNRRILEETWNRKASQEDIDRCKKERDSQAEIGLARYNKKRKDAEFEFVEIVQYSRFYKHPRRWIHINFKAKPKNVPATDKNTKLFFAELVQDPSLGGEAIATICSKLKPIGKGAGQCFGCRFLIHPLSGYYGGDPSQCEHCVVSKHLLKIHNV